MSLDVVAPYLHRLGGGEIEPAIVVADRVARFLREEGFSSFVRVLLADYPAGYARVSLEVSPEIHGRVATLAHSFRRFRAAVPTLGERLGAKAAVNWYGAHQLRLSLVGLRPWALFTPAGDDPIPDMVPLMARRMGNVIFADRALLGSPLLIGEPAHGPRDGLGALLACLLARRGSAVRAWAIAGEGLPGGALLTLPQWAAEPIDPDDTGRVLALLEKLVAELARHRATSAAAEPAAREELILAIGEAADLSNDDDARLVEVLARDGPRHGIRLVDLSYFPRPADHRSFARLALVATHRRGVTTAGVVAAASDGALGAQEFVDDHRPDAVRILDRRHAAGYLGAVATARFGVPDGGAARWLAARVRELLDGDPDTVLGKLRGRRDALAPAAAGAGAKLESVISALQYLEARRAQIAYADFRAAGDPIGSGAVEGANTLVGEARLKGAGMHWARCPVDSMVALRTVVCSDRWDEAWPRLAAELRRQAAAGARQKRQARRPPTPRHSRA